MAGIASVLARGPIGALIDRIHWKRGLIALAAVTVGVSSLLIALVPSFPVILIAQRLTGMAEAVFPAALAAISLGMVGPSAYTRRIGRNEAFNHAGNVAGAVMTGLSGWLIRPAAVLWVAVLLSGASLLSLRGIRPESINDDLARNAAQESSAENPAVKQGGLRGLWNNRPLVTFTLAITLFHFANAAMLPLLGEKLSRGHGDTSSLLMAGCIVSAQLAMIPMALIVGRKADVWGRKPLFLVAFVILPLRGWLFSMVHDPSTLIGLQLLDGIGAGIFGALFFIVIADMTRGSGQYNLAQGVSAACWGLGAALSNVVAGWIVTQAGFSVAFGFLTTCAVAALMVFWLGVPETLENPPSDALTSRTA